MDSGIMIWHENMLYYKLKRLFEGMWPDPLPQAFVCRLKIVHHHYPFLHGSLYFIEKKIFQKLVNSKYMEQVRCI
jgi:hypothetical protein